MSGFDILAKLEPEGNTVSGPVETACDFCELRSKSVSVNLLRGYPPAPVLVAEPPNSQIGGQAAANLVFGTLKGRAISSAFGNLEEHKMGFVARVRETVTVTFPQGLPQNQRVVRVVGSGHGFANVAGIGVASVSFTLEANGVRASGAQEQGASWEIVEGEGNSGVTAGTSGSGCQIGITVKPPTSGEVSVSATLAGTTHAIGVLGVGAGVAEVNALNTGQIGLELPAGATFTSTSGVFLTASPEPEISLAIEGSELVISFSGALESSEALADGGWSAVAGATSPYRVALPLTGARFFRARTP